MAQPHPNPFASLITANCHVTPSQSALHRAAPFFRHHELFPGESSSSQYHIPVETTEIRMESPPEEENVFPSSQEVSLPPATSPEPMILERETRVMGEVINSLKGKDKVFDKMPMRKQEAKTVSIEIIDLDDEEEYANFPMKNTIEAESNVKSVDLDDVAVPTRSGEVENARNKCVEQCRDGNEEVNKNKLDTAEKNMSKIDTSKSNVGRTRASSVSEKIKEDETMKNLLDGLDLVISIDNEKMNNSKPDEKVDILGIAMRRGLICNRVSWWPPEKKIQQPGVGHGSGCD